MLKKKIKFWWRRLVGTWGSTLTNVIGIWECLGLDPGTSGVKGKRLNQPAVRRC